MQYLQENTDLNVVDAKPAKLKRKNRFIIRVILTLTR